MEGSLGVLDNIRDHPEQFASAIYSRPMIYKSPCVSIEG